MGIIYKLKSPELKDHASKPYVGQTRGTFESRMGSHKSASANLKKTDGCRLLNNAIRKYGWDNFIKEVIWECPDEQLDFWETFFIIAFSSLAPNGYNLTTGGNSNLKSNATKLKMRESALARDSSKYRKIEGNEDLPKYIGSYKKGYRIAKHPRCPIMYFCKKPTPEENLIAAKEYLEKLNNDETIIVVPKKHDLGEGIQRCGNGYRARYINKSGKELTARFTTKDVDNNELLERAKKQLAIFKENDK